MFDGTERTKDGLESALQKHEGVNLVNFKKALTFIAVFSFALCSCDENRDIDQLRLPDYKKFERYGKLREKRLECLDKSSKYLHSFRSCNEYFPGLPGFGSDFANLTTWRECVRMRDEDEKLREKLKKEWEQCKCEENELKKEWEQCEPKIMGYI
ncbi:MAG: hypothetical protein LE168_05440 [Endomicrobium sp.]|nr:hypothetical protein [Endomicrobium sp.]